MKTDVCHLSVPGEIKEEEGIYMAKKRYRLKWRTKLLLASALLRYFFFLFTQQAIEMQRQQNKIEELNQAISQVQLENEVLTRQIEHTQSDAYIENAARDKLGWIKEGETIFIEKNN